jgi:photosystem II stability/assembly factor-like uncharacterized protein
MRSHILLLIILSTSITCFSQKKITESASQKLITEDYDSSTLTTLKWRCIGPWRGGRCIAVTGVINQPYIYYMGATGGGIWKTSDGGNTWSPLSDSAFHSSSVGSLAVAASNANIIYAGMGEYAIRNTAIMGDGIYKSIDAGKTWKHILNLDASAVGRILVNPLNPDVVYAAVMGKMFGANKERGVYRSTDGGTTWKQILHKNDSTGAIDVRFDPNNPAIIYASLWQVYRNSWSLNDGGRGSGLYKSTDGGDTWSLLSNNPGLPKGILGKMTIAVAASNSNHIYAMVENKNGGLFSSMDAGRTWSRVSTQNDLTQRPWYFSGVWVDPKNENHVYIMNVQFWQSIDGGKTFAAINQEHGDNHDMWINPDNPDNFIIGDDGSAAVTFNGGKTWTNEDLPTGQFYHVNLDNDFPYNAYGGQQDWGPIRIATRTTGYSIGKSDWYIPAGGEAGYIVPDPTNPQVTYGGEYDGIMTRHDKSNNQNQVVSVYPEINDGAGVIEKKHRFQWTYPIAFSPWNANTLYCTSQFVHRSTNGGMSWETISPDLTTNDTTKQRQSGGPITADNTGAEVYCDIYAFAESPAKQGVLWAGSDDGLVHVSKDNGKNWENVTPAALPKWATVSIIDPSHFDEGTCYFAAHAYRIDNTRPYIFRTTDYGKTWQLITNGLPQNVYARCVREDPNRKGLLYAGVETGVYVSFDNGNRWHTLQQNLPVTPVHDIQIKKDMKEVVLATHGRAFWVLDDVSPLYELNTEVNTSNAHLFTPRVSYRMDGFQYDASDLQDGINAPNGVIIYYRLNKPVSKELKLEFLTDKGDSIITYSDLKDRRGKVVEKNEDFYEQKKDKIEDVLKNEAGTYRFVWDLSYGDAKRFSDDWIYNGEFGGARALPGNYKVRLYNGDTLLAERSFSIELNPKVKSTSSDLQAQFDLMNQITKKQTEVSTAIKQLQSVRKQINDFVNGFEDTAKIKPLKDMSKPILDSLQGIEDVLYQSKIKAGEDGLRYPVKLMEKLGALKQQVAYGDARPTQQSFDLFNDLSQRLSVPLQKLKNIIDTQVPKFNQAAAQYKSEAVDVNKGLK